MAYDVLYGTVVPRDWSIGASEADELKKETWTEPQIRGLADMADREINHNVALADKRLKAGTLDKNEGSKFAEFARGFKKWRSENLAPGKKLVGETADKVKQWRGENAAWTAKLSETPRDYVLVTRSIGVLAVVEKKPRKWPLIAGAAGLLGIGWLLGKRG